MKSFSASLSNLTILLVQSRDSSSLILPEPKTGDFVALFLLHLPREFYVTAGMFSLIIHLWQENNLPVPITQH
jgi:hypothetical protein